MLDYLGSVFDTSGFPPRWHCGSWTPAHGWLHIGSDFAIWGAYTAIPCVLIWFALRRGDLPFLRIFWLFGAFILACGTGHLIESIIFWQPVYRLSGLVKLATAIVSWGTVIALVQTVPKALAYPGVATLMEQLREERGLAVKALSENQRRLQMALDAGRMGVWEWNLETDVVLLDRRELTLCGLDETWALTTAKKFFSRVHPEDMPALRAAIDKARASGEYTHEFRFRLPDGRVRWLAGRGTVLPVGEGKPLRMVGVNYDVTPQKEAEAALREATRAANAANAAKSAFLANVSHEIRTPMTAILGYARLLESGDMRVDQDEALGTIISSGEHLLALINDILDLSKVEAGELSFDNVRFAPLEPIEDVVRVLRVRAEEKGLALAVVVGSPLPATIAGDPRRLRQVVMNLVGNAIKFTSQGSVTIRVRLDVAREPTRLAIEVSDTGPGIAAGDLMRIFEPFTQLEPGADGRGGTGLGLAISRRLTERVGGDLLAQSTLGQGSTFTVRWPVGDLRGVPLEESNSELVAGLAAAKPADESVGRLAACQVLLVEDTMANRKIISLMLTAAGADVTVAENGLEALDRVAEAQQARRSFDVILMDMAMPELDGFAATRQLRERGITTPIIALTAHAMAEDRQRCLAAGCDDYLAKPLDRAELIERIRRHRPA